MGRKVNDPEYYAKMIDKVSKVLYKMMIGTNNSYKIKPKWEEACVKTRRKYRHAAWLALDYMSTKR